MPSAQAVALPKVQKLKLFCKTISAKLNKKRLAFFTARWINYEKMSAGSKLMIKMFKKMVEAKKEKTEADMEMLKMISRSYDISDKKYIEPIIKLLHHTSDTWKIM